MRILIYLFFVIALLLFPEVSNAQLKSRENIYTQNWSQYLLNINFKSGYSLLGDVGYRTEKNIQNCISDYLRVGFYKEIGRDSKIGIGIAQFDYYKNIALINTERRLFQDLNIWNQKKNQKIGHRIRAEEQLFSTSNNRYLNLRLRYQFLYQYILWKSERGNRNLSIQNTDEIFYSFNPNKSLEQNANLRINAGIHYMLIPELTFQLSYSTQFVIRQKENDIIHSNVFLFTIQNDFSIGKKNRKRVRVMRSKHF